jgi:hypothetical protein
MATQYFGLVSQDGVKLAGDAVAATWAVTRPAMGGGGTGSDPNFRWSGRYYINFPAASDVTTMTFVATPVVTPGMANRDTDVPAATKAWPERDPPGSGANYNRIVVQLFRPLNGAAFDHGFSFIAWAQ